jgi:hypothetical protein
MGAAVAVLFMRERHIVDAFVRAGSTRPDRTATPEDIGVERYGVGWRRLLAHDVLREWPADSGQYYLDQDLWRALRRRRRRMAGMAVAIGLLLFVWAMRRTWMP